MGHSLLNNGGNCYSKTDNAITVLILWKVERTGVEREMQELTLIKSMLILQCDLLY